MTSAQVTQASKSPEPRMVRANYPEVKLDAAQSRQWSETLAAVNWIGPGFCHLLYSMLNKRGDSQVALFTEINSLRGGDRRDPAPVQAQRVL